MLNYMNIAWSVVSTIIYSLHTTDKKQAVFTINTPNKVGS